MAIGQVANGWPNAMLASCSLTAPQKAAESSVLPKETDPTRYRCGARGHTSSLCMCGDRDCLLRGLPEQL